MIVDFNKHIHTLFPLTTTLSPSTPFSGDSFSFSGDCSFIMHRGYSRLVVAHILAATTIGLIWAAAKQRRRKNPKSSKPEIVPRLDLTGSGHAGRLESFSHYVARQIGFRDENECPELSKLASDYVRSSKGFADGMYVYFSNEKDIETPSEKLVEELERCVLGYFAFHWSQTSLMINKVLSVGSDERKLKNMVLTATRAFWSEAATNAVVVEADAFKETDVIYKALSSMGHHSDMLQTAELVHQTSTDAASSLLVTALNEGRDVIMDGTLSWEPFVEQTIAMARSVHKYRYRMGVGYKASDDGTIVENYWEKIENKEDEVKLKKPYRIELVGVICDAHLAVIRGIRRAIAVKRAVRVNSQLQSHKRFANAFPKYCHLVDNAKLFCTNATGVPPKLIGWKDGNNNLLVDREQIKCLETLREINEQADSIYELYADPKTLSDPDSVWNEAVLKPTRIDLQQDLKNIIEGIEKSTS